MAADKVIRDYWAALDRADWGAVAQLLAVDFAAEYPATGENFDKPGFLRLNAEYPGRWYAEVVEVVTEGQRVVTRTRVTDGVESHVVASFALVRDGKVTRLVEVWAEEGTAPPADRRPV